MPEIAYVNGRFLPLEQATVHVEDRGFQFADGVYEVLRTYNGKPFAVEEHMARLWRSLSGIELTPDFTVQHIKDIIAGAVERAGFAEAIVYIQVTRGRAPRHRGFPFKIEPTLVVTVRALKQLSETIRQKGITVITVPDNRWAHCDIKSVALLGNVLAYQAAHNAGVDDAVFIGNDGLVAEATAGNVFLVTGGRLRTPPNGPRLLGGITRDKMLQSARAAGIPCAEEPMTAQELVRADEVFLTSTTAEVIPVVIVDGRTIGSGKPGPVTDRVYKQFQRMFTEQ